MTTTEYPIPITADQYDVLSNNQLISICCDTYLETAVEYDDGEIELSLTLPQLTDLIGYVAAEANHARSKKQSEVLNALCDHLEIIELGIKRQEQGNQTREN